MLCLGEGFLHLVPVVLLIGVVDLWALSSKPRQHLSQLAFLRAMAHRYDGCRINSLRREQIVECHRRGLSAIGTCGDEEQFFSARHQVEQGMEPSRERTASGLYRLKYY